MAGALVVMVLCGCGARDELKFGAAVFTNSSGLTGAGAGGMTSDGTAGPSSGGPTLGPTSSVGSTGSAAAGSTGFAAGGSPAGAGGATTGSAGSNGIGSDCPGDGAAGRGPNMVCLASGTITLGDEEVGEPLRPGVMMPSYWIDETEVTVAQYRACVEAGTCFEPDPFHETCNYSDDPLFRPDHPINCIHFVAAEQFCDWAGKRLPTGDEWEYAARGAGDAPRLYPWGNEPADDQLCWQRDEPCEVGSFPQGNTASGLMDMAGSMRELTTDCLTRFSNCWHVVRGGGFNAQWWLVPRSGYRREASEDHALVRTNGFRCVR